jgi:hypothetical protein
MSAFGGKADIAGNVAYPPFQRSLAILVFRSTKSDDPVRFSARRIHLQYCGYEIALEEGLREFWQAYLVPWAHVCITSREQDGNIGPFASNYFGEFRSGHFWHGLIGNDEIDRILAPENFERFLTGMGLEYSVAEVRAWPQYSSRRGRRHPLQEWFQNARLKRNRPGDPSVFSEE